MIPRSRRGCEKWLNFHRGAFRPPSGGGSLRRRPPAPSASRRFEPVKLVWLCDCVSPSDVNERARAPRPLKVREVPASFSVISLLFEQWAPFASAHWLALPERSERRLAFAVCVWKRKTAVIETCAKLISVWGRLKRWAVCRGWRKPVSSSERVICGLVKPSQLKLVSRLPLINVSRID